MNAHDFLSLAHLLAARPEEAAWRSAISRGYYAAFHVARLLLEDLGFTVPRADRAHGYLWLRLANCSDASVQDTGSKLNLLRRHRNQADYDLAAAFTQAFAQGRVRTAELIIQALVAAAIEPTRTQITDAMKIYERDVLHDVTWHP
ncbi:MAG TPA: HEPN domain-containing protein, partial [Gemmataceae bacterium]